jgi:hypothetical protein
MMTIEQRKQELSLAARAWGLQLAQYYFYIYKCRAGACLAETFWTNRRCRLMKGVALTVALLLATSPALAQTVTQGQASITPREGQASSASSQASTPICQEEMDGTFCTAVGSPSNSGYGLTNGSGGTVGSSAVPTPTPPCGDFPPPAVLCN